MFLLLSKSVLAGIAVLLPDNGIVGAVLRLPILGTTFRAPTKKHFGLGQALPLQIGAIRELPLLV